jgi:hypothetical protein
METHIAQHWKGYGMLSFAAMPGDFTENSSRKKQIWTFFAFLLLMIIATL